MRYMFMRYPGGLTKAVTLSYDDGCPEDVRFSDVISKAGFKCTFNLNNNDLFRWHGREPLSKEVIEEKFLSRGHEIAVHGAMHRAPGKVRAIEGIRDILDCRLELEERFGFIIRGMAYPDSGIVDFHNGASYDSVKNYLTDLGIVYSRTLAGDNDRFMLPTDWHAWMPNAHHDNPQIMEYIEKFTSMKVDDFGVANRYPRLFYIWGHAYEFDKKNNWEHLDEICEKLGGHEDIWYATNIEIYNYVTAYNSLVYSANGKIIYNPTLTDVFFEVDGVPYEIKSGQTIKI